MGAMTEQRVLEIDTILWHAWQKKSEKYKEKVTKDLIEFGKLNASCGWWKEEESKGVNYGNESKRNLSRS